MFHYIVCFIISILISTTYSRSIRSLTNEPERCCWTKQFSADVSTSSSIRSFDGKTENVLGTHSLAYDADRGLIALKGGSTTSETGKQSWTWVIQNIKNKKVYTIDETAKTCSISPLPVLPNECVPESASYSHSNTTGNGDKKIITDTWVIETAGVRTTMTVTRDGLCIPLSEEVSAPIIGFSSSQTIIHFVPKIEDPSIFEIPKQCLQVA